MARTLRYLGLAILALTAWLLLAQEFGWVGRPERLDVWVLRGVWAGLGCIAAGILLSLLNPVGRALRQGRCARCGATIERGQTYCLDHLQATLNEYRDETRNGLSG